MRNKSFLVLAILLSACSLKQDHTTGWSAAQLYEAGKSNMEGGGLQASEDYYNKLLARYPYGRIAQQAMLDLAYVQYKNAERDKALKTLEEFIRTYPQHPYMDYALFLKGVVEYEHDVSIFDRIMPTNLAQTDAEMMKQAFNTFATLVQNYPNSKYAEDAKYRMVFIRNLIGEHILEVANYYLRHGSYTASASRAKQVLAEFEQTPSAPYALAILVRSYKEMGEEKLASDALRVLQQNFPNMMQDKEIKTYLSGNIKKQRSFKEQVMMKPKISMPERIQ